MDYSIVITVISAIAAVGSAIFAAYAYGVGKTTLLHQGLVDVRKDYRSPEMQYAIETLWDFYREHGREKLAEKYEEIRQEEKKWISSLEKQGRIEAERSTLHYQRRLVSHFYQHLAGLYVNGVLPKKTLHKIWSKEALRIIPDILVPIENKLREVLNTPPKGPLDENSDLLVLYKDSTVYEDSKERKMLRSFVQFTALFLTFVAAVFLIKGNLTLSVPDIAKITQTGFLYYNKEVVFNLAGQQADTIVGFAILMISFGLQMGNSLWEMRFSDFGVNKKGLIISIVVSALIFFVGWNFSGSLKDRTIATGLIKLT